MNDVSDSGTRDASHSVKQSLLLLLPLVGCAGKLSEMLVLLLGLLLLLLLPLPLLLLLV